MEKQDINKMTVQELRDELRRNRSARDDLTALFRGEFSRIQGELEKFKADPKGRPPALPSNIVDYLAKLNKQIGELKEKLDSTMSKARREE